MTERERNTLYSCGLFQYIQPEDMPLLLSCLHGEEAVYEKNEIIWHIGDPVTSCAVILSGAVRAETVDASGAHALMAFHTTGALVGDVLMATPGSTSPVYVTAAEDTRVYFIPFRQLMGGCPHCCGCHTQLRKNLVAEIANKFWAQRRRAAYLSSGSLRRRIAMYLRDRAGQEHRSTFSVGGTREDLADFLCVNRSALSRELSRMKGEGILDCYKDTFRILDEEKLEAAAN